MANPLRHTSSSRPPVVFVLICTLALSFALAACARLRTTLAPARTGVVRQVTDQTRGVSPLATRSPPKGLIVTSIEPVKSGPWLNVQWSPDGTKALVDKDQVQHYLLYSEGNDANSKPAPAGTSVGVGSLWLVDLKTGAEELLLESVGSASWSPTSDQVAVIAPTASDGIGGMLFILDLASGKQTVLGPVDFLGSDYSVQWLLTGKVLAVRDGELLAFDPEQQQAPEPAGMRLASWVAVDAGKADYTQTPETPVRFRIAPDALHIAYLTASDNQRAIAYKLWLGDLSEETPPVFVTAQAEGSYMEWSPDSQRLVFNTYHDLKEPVLDVHLPATQQLWVVDTDGGQAQQLAQADAYRWLLSPVWSPDSKLIAFGDFGTSEDSQPPELRISDTRTTEADSLTWISERLPIRTPFAIWWEPSGDRWLVTYDEGPRSLEHVSSLRTVWLNLESDDR